MQKMNIKEKQVIVMVMISLVMEKVVEKFIKMDNGLIVGIITLS